MALFRCEKCEIFFKSKKGYEGHLANKHAPKLVGADGKPKTKKEVEGLNKVWNYFHNWTFPCKDPENDEKTRQFAENKQTFDLTGKIETKGKTRQNSKNKQTLDLTGKKLKWNCGKHSSKRLNYANFWFN